MISDQQLQDHEAYLREKIFFTETRWPQYNLLLMNLKSLADSMPWKATVHSYERNVLYGGTSMFKPFFRHQYFTAIDRTPPENRSRGGYNNIRDQRKLELKNDLKGSYNPDLIIIPNLLHHIKSVDAFFWEIVRNLKPGGELYVFEPMLRELHQEPEHYIQFTPHGLASILESFGLEIEITQETGGPFTALYYFLDQARQYVPDGDAFMDELFPSEMSQKDLCDGFIGLDAKYPANLKRPHTSCPTAFSVLAKKPNG